VGVQEVDEWLRERCIENMFTSASTLHSLGQLLDKISNIVINDDIAAEVTNIIVIVICIIHIIIITASRVLGVW